MSSSPTAPDNTSRSVLAQTTEGAEDTDPYLSAVFEKNNGNLEQALELCQQQGATDKDERYTYLMASIQALAGAEDEALDLLQAAIRLEPKNRVHAYHDPGLRAVAWARRVRATRPSYLRYRVSSTTKRPVTPSSGDVAPNGRKELAAGPSLVAIGGGSGLAVLLRGLKAHMSDPDQLTAVVTVADDGGSSGRLRREFGVLPPGDIRNCIVALADDEDLLARLFQYRFANGGGLAGHSFGNLFLTALTGITGDFYQAVLTAESILSVRGRILPATLTDVRLRGKGLSGNLYEGESAVGQSGERLVDLELIPASIPAFPPSIEALRQADLILLGPGSLYTSVLPNLLIPGILQAVCRSPAKVVLVLNIMTQPGETDHMNAIDHLLALERHVASLKGNRGETLIDFVLVNATRPPQDLLEHYAETGSELVSVDRDAFAEHDVTLVERDLLAEGALIRHDPGKLSRAILEMV